MARQVWLDVDGARVEAWFLPVTRRQHPRRSLIHAHGNGELIDMQTPIRRTRLRAAGIAVLLVEYPGYGRSAGAPSEESRDRDAAWRRTTGQEPTRASTPQRIVGYGRSLGGGAVAQLAARRPLAALVLESTFTSIGELVRADGIPGWLRGESIRHARSAARSIQGRCCMLHGTQ